jgi:hypothetical protein
MADQGDRVVGGIPAGRVQANVGHGTPRAYEFVDRRSEKGNIASTPGRSSL